MVACGKKNIVESKPFDKGRYRTVCKRVGWTNFGYLYGKWDNLPTLYPIYAVYNSRVRIQKRCYWWPL